jgi:hypothetical protein
MKKNPFWLFLWIFLLINSCIVIRSRQVDDGTKSLTKEDSAKIFPFDIGSINQKTEYTTSSEIVFQRITANDLKKLMPLKPYTWVLICASWCPISERAITKYSELAMRISEDSLQLVIISQDLNIKALQKEIFQASYAHVPYLMDSKLYGTDEHNKQKKFISDFNKNLPLDFFKSGGVPTCLLFNQNAELLYLTGGAVINCDTIKKYTNLECKKNQ